MPLVWVGLWHLRGFSTYFLNTLPRRVWSVGTVSGFPAYFLLREKYVKLNTAEIEALREIGTALRGAVVSKVLLCFLKVKERAEIIARKHKNWSEVENKI